MAKKAFFILNVFGAISMIWVVQGRGYLNWLFQVASPLLFKGNGYAGFLAGPPLIGLLAKATSLQLSLFLIAIMVGSLVFTGRALRIVN